MLRAWWGQLTRPPSLGGWAQSPLGEGEEGSSRHWASHTHTKPQAIPPCCLGSLALGQPCAEAMERDVPLIEEGVGPCASFPGYHYQAWRGLESEVKGQPA